MGEEDRRQPAAPLDEAAPDAAAGPREPKQLGPIRYAPETIERILIGLQARGVEVRRVLRPGGAVCIVPLYLFDVYAVQTDPAVAVAAGVQFEPDAVLYCD